MSSRYTPLLAWMLVPNIWIHPAWGKVLFSGTDIFIAALLRNIILLRTPSISPSKLLLFCSLWIFNPFAINVSTRGNAESLVIWLPFCLSSTFLVCFFSLSFSFLGRCPRSAVAVSVVLQKIILGQRSLRTQRSLQNLSYSILFSSY